MAKYNNGISSTSSNRRTIKTLREVIASTKPNVVLVPNDNKYERESFLVHKRALNFLFQKIKTLFSNKKVFQSYGQVE